MKLFVTRRAAVLAFAFAAGAARAGGATPESEALRARVEQIAEQPEATLYGVHVAPRRALPRLYELRGFTPAWTSPGARADLLRAVRDSARRARPGGLPALAARVGARAGRVARTRRSRRASTTSCC